MPSARARFCKLTDRVGVTRTAEALGISQPQVSRYRTGDQIPTLRIAARIEVLTAGTRGGRIRAADWVDVSSIPQPMAASGRR